MFQSARAGISATARAVELLLVEHLPKLAGQPTEKFVAPHDHHDPPQSLTTKEVGQEVNGHSTEHEKPATVVPPAVAPPVDVTTVAAAGGAELDKNVPSLADVVPHVDVPVVAPA